MSNLVTVKIHVRDKNRQPLKNFKIRTYPISRSSAKMVRTTDSNGNLQFKASSNSNIGIDVIEPNGTYKYNCTINSLNGNNRPIIIGVERTEQDYQSSNSDLITFYAIIKDSNGLVMPNFPVKTAYKDSSRESNVKYTGEDGVVKLYSSPNRTVSIKPLMPNDRFEVHSNLLITEPKSYIIKLKDTLEKYRSKVILKLVDKDGDNKYPNAKFKLASKHYKFAEDKFYQDGNGDSIFPITTFVGDELGIKIFKPDGTFLNEITYVVTRMQHELTVKVPVYISTTRTEENEPEDEEVMEGNCSCNKDITLSQLKKICPHRSESILKRLLPYLNSTFEKYQINTCLRKSHFLAQVCHESAEFLYKAEQISESSSISNYSGYKGRGFMQLTFKSAYKSYGEYVGVNFLGVNKTKLEEDKYAIDSAGWFWVKYKWKNINELADDNDIIGISSIVNGGFNGFDDRLNYFEKAVGSLGARKCINLNNSERNTILVFNFPDSIVYRQMIGESFGWGLWHDPNFKKKGCTKHKIVAKEGYENFLRLDSQGKKFGSNKRYGYTQSRAREVSKQRVQNL